MGYRVLIGYRLEVIVASLEEVLYVVPPLGEGNLGHDLVVDDEVALHDFPCHVDHFFSKEAAEDIFAALHRHFFSKSVCGGLDEVYVGGTCQGFPEFGACVIEFGYLLLGVGQVLCHEAIPLAHHHHVVLVGGNHVNEGVDAAVYFHDDLCPVLPQGTGQVAPSVEGGGGFGLKEEHGN